MVYINLKELRTLQATGLSLTKIAQHYNVNVFHLNNFIWSHKHRNGTYPVDGTRSRKVIKPKHNYPELRTIANMLKTQTIKSVADQLSIPYEALRAHIKKTGIRYVKTKTRVTPLQQTGADIFAELERDPNSLINKLK